VCDASAGARAQLAKLRAARGRRSSQRRERRLGVAADRPAAQHAPAKTQLITS
jgi:hypothetical protein